MHSFVRAVKGDCMWFADGGTKGIFCDLLETGPAFRRCYTVLFTQVHDGDNTLKDTAQFKRK
jgi:hypothetical protein